MSIESLMPSNHLILCHPFLLLLSIFPSIRVFSHESVLRIRWPKYWSFSFNISLSSEYSGLISFRMDCLDLLAIQGTLKSLLQHHSSKTSILRCSASPFSLAETILHPIACLACYPLLTYYLVSHYCSSLLSSYGPDALEIIIITVYSIDISTSEYPNLSLSSRASFWWRLSSRSFHVNHKFLKLHTSPHIWLENARILTVVFSKS